MPFIAAPRVWQVNVRYILFGQQVENVLHFHQPEDPIDTTSAQNLALTLWGAWSEHVMGTLSSNLLLRELYIVDQSSDTGLTYTYAPIPGVNGDIGEASLPGNVAFCVSLRTIARGRSHRGRIYLPGIPEPNVTGNTLDASLVTSMVTAVDNVRNAMATQGFNLTVLSRYHNNAPRESAVHTPVSTVLAVDDTVDSQRRRLNGRGR